MLHPSVLKILNGECKGCEKRRAALQEIMAQFRACAGNPIKMAELARKMVRVTNSPETEIEQQTNIAKKTTEG